MNAIDFLSSGDYLVVPNLSNPKVLLNISTTIESQNSFKLFNPGSLKGRIVKWILTRISRKQVFLKKLPLYHESQSKSEFINWLGNELNQDITSSVYIATEKDKLVIQVQSSNEILGYIKFPISEQGEKRLLNEINAIEILSVLNIIAPAEKIFEYKSRKILFLKNIQGKIVTSEFNDVNSILLKFKKDRKFHLNNHPRVNSILKQLEHFEMNDVLNVINFKLQNSDIEYSEVFEHGDFAPWNIIENNGEYVPFDFEYFEEVGLEGFDELKYHFQIGFLLRKLKQEKLISYVKEKTNFVEFEIIFIVFLGKEIVKKISEDKSAELEIELIKILNGKT